MHQLYAAFNSQDAERLLALVTDDVNWPDGTARLHGKNAVRAYWARQWIPAHTHDELSTARFVHIFQLRGGLVSRMDIEPPDLPLEITDRPTRM